VRNVNCGRDFFPRKRSTFTAAELLNAPGWVHVAQVARVKRLKTFRRGGIWVCCESFSHVIGPSSIEK